MIKIKTLSIAGLMCLCIMLPVFSPAAFAVDGKEIAEDLDNYFGPAFPVVYGEIIDSLPPEGVAGISAALKGIEIFDYIYKIGKIGDSLASGNADMDTALDSATVAANLAIKLLADGTTKKILIAGVGVGTLPLTALITSIDIARSSSRAVAQSKIALDLEILYYSVENDPVLRDRNRELGEGNPIKTDEAAVEHLFRKCLMDQSWSALFKTYVTTELGQEWPEPSLWDRLTVDNDFLEEASILSEKKRLKSHIASLLLELNKVAKKQEARVVVAKKMQEIEAMAGKISPEELRKALSLYNSALQKLPEIQQYTGSLPDTVKKYEEMAEKAKAVELEKLRGETLPSDMKKIVSCMSYVRYLPTKGRYAGTRESLLRELKDAYTSLFNIKNNVSVKRINARLEEEAKELTVKDQMFEFKRYPCPKFFEDYLPAFETDVKNGNLSPEGLSKVYEEIYTSNDELSQSYDEDYKANEKIYNEKIREFDDKIKETNTQISEIKNRIAATTDNNTLKSLRESLNRLEQTLNSLKGERKKLVEQFNAYTGLFQANATVDLSQSKKIISEIKEYIEAYGNKFQNIQSYLKNCYQNALSIYGEFSMSHSGDRLSEGFVSESKIDEIDEILSKNTGSVYAYLDLEYLKDLVKPSPDKAMSSEIEKILEDITDAVKRTLSQVAALKITVKSEWVSWTLTQLRYMESNKCKNDIDTVLDVIQKAQVEYRNVDQDDISKEYREEYDQDISMLEAIKTGMERYKILRNRAAGLSSRLESYISQADRVNQQVEEDRVYLIAVYTQLMNARARLKGFLASYTVRALSTGRDVNKCPSGLSSKEIKEVLDDTGMITFSNKRALGITELFNEPFIDLYTDKGVVTARKDHLQNLLADIKKLPVDSYDAYNKAYHHIKDQEGLEGLLFSLIQFDSEFLTLFSFDTGMEETAKKVLDALKEKRDRVNKTQAAVDEENARFSIILNKIEHLIKFCNDQIAMGNYSSVMVLGPQADEVDREYKEFAKKRSDIDEGLIELTELIELAKEKYIEAENSRNNSNKGQEEIREFYQKFKTAYESRDDYQVMNLIDQEWEAGDGTTLTDLEMNLSRTFRTFDEINYNISNINISPMPQGTYLVTYDVDITSRMFSRNLKHEEKSSVSEEVSVEENGRVKIVRTLNGRFWQD